MGSCEICNKREAAVIKSSSLGPISFVACEDCSNKGIEPYFMIMTRLCIEAKSIDDFDYERKKKIKEALNIYGVSIEQFNIDLKWYKENNYIYKIPYRFKLYNKLKSIIQK